MVNQHLVILKQHYLDLIIDGQKKIESRLTKTKRPFFGQVKAGDVLFLKQSSGPVCAKAKVKKALHFDNLTPQQIQSLKVKYNHLILGFDDYWQSRTDCKYGVLVWLKDVKQIKPLWIKKRDWRAWVVLTEKENFELFRYAVFVKTSKLTPNTEDR
ncbi:MAG: ASCH domain-containing protein [Sedimentisphaerales bacterium]|nr:ASCH domain-containing protein [Sedimentisphaerales bacterium]